MSTIISRQDDEALSGVEWKNAGPCIWIANTRGPIGPSGRFVDYGDLITVEEAGNGESHGTAFRIPADRGIAALLRAAIQRVDALEDLLVSGSDDELAAEASEIAKVKARRETA